MQRLIIVKCPMALTLFLNVETTEPDIKVKLIKQTVALQDTNAMDEVSLKKSNSLELQGDILDIEKEKIIKTLKIFQEITGVKVENICINVKRICMRFSSISNIEAGLLIGLNEFYHTNLSMEELKKIGNKIDNLVSYFLVGGFKKIDEEKGELVSLPKNIYQSYIIIDKKESILLPNQEKIKKYGVVAKDYKEDYPYSDYEKLVSDNYQEIKEYLKEYKEIVSSLIGNTSLYVVTSRDNLLLSRMNYRLKQEFPSYNFYRVENTSGPKILIKNSSF